MVRRIEVSLKPEFTDAAAESLLARLQSDFGLSGLKIVRRVNVYTFEDDLPDADLQLLAREVLSDPVNQAYAVGKPVDATFDALIEVSFRPGVKDNVGETAKAAAADALGRELPGGVYTSTAYQFFGDFPFELAQRIAEGVLCNPLIEQWKVLDLSGADDYYARLSIPKAGERVKGSVFEIPLPDAEAELERISKRRLLALNLEEMKAIAEHYRRPEVRAARAKAGLSIHPTDVELEAIAQTWSEHCKHKIFNATIEYADHSPDDEEEKTSKPQKSKKSAKNPKPKKETIHSLFKTYIAGTTTAIHSAKPYLLSVFVDNAGVIAMDEDWAIAVKVETHNTPSALDPYGGALTGILGVNRDVLGTGLGAKPIFNTDVFCFADPNYSGKIPPRQLHPKRVFEGVRAGVERGGNASGIPTVNGSIVFDDRYLGKPL
ncbi:MAG: phosphoribosylformylglycinamidine synthase, partial [Candidatus Micrarchaeota archaeon]|nr:phosphoribosylformylglycinamidine synthase [Candidatus Micrarchaeota archaeon]